MIEQVGDVVLPAGWTVINESRWFTTVQAPTGYSAVFVTIDWGERCFRGGMSNSGYPKLGASYAGRGWKRCLVDDAVAWLQGVVNS